MGARAGGARSAAANGPFAAYAQAAEMGAAIFSPGAYLLRPPAPIAEMLDHTVGGVLAHRVGTDNELYTQRQGTGENQCECRQAQGLAPPLAQGPVHCWIERRSYAKCTIGLLSTQVLL
jgi:hypothetical protein